MAYETQLLPPDYEAARNHGTIGDALYTQYDQPLSRPYVSDATLFYEQELGVSLQEPEEEEPYDPLTASFEEVVGREYGSWEAYNAQDTAWDHQANAAFQEQRAHGEALARTIAFQSMKRVSEYRAKFPKDTDTIQLRIVEPEPSSVDVVLAELRQLRDEIEHAKQNPPRFYTPEHLSAKQYERPAPIVREPASSSEALAAQPAESELTGGSTRTRFEKLKALSAHGARRFISRITRQAVLWG